MDLNSESQKTQNSKKNLFDKFGSYFRNRINTALGIEISDTSIELIEFNPFFSHKLRSFSRVLLEKGIVERGKIFNKEMLEQKLQVLLKNAKPRKISTNRIILSLPESQVFSWGTAMDSSLSESETRLRILDESKKHIPLDYKKLYWDYTTYKLPKKSLQYVTFVAIYKNILNDYVEVCSKLGLEVVEFSLASLATSKIFLPAIDKNTNVILDIGAEKSNVTIFEGNSLLKLSITIPIAGNAFTEAIANDLKITKLEAEEMKVKFGITSSSPLEYKNSIQKIVDELLSEVKLSINYYEKNSGETVDEIYLSGGSSLMLGLEPYIQQKLNIKIEQVNPSFFLQKSKFFQNEINPKLFMGAIGLALVGITKNIYIFSFRKQISIIENKMGFIQKIRTGYFDSTSMIFSFKHVTYLLLTIFALVALLALVWMWIDIKPLSLIKI